MFLVYFCATIGAFIIVRGVVSALYLAWNSAKSIIDAKKALKKFKSNFINSNK